MLLGSSGSRTAMGEGLRPGWSRSSVLGTAGWIFIPGLAWPDSKSRSPRGLEPGCGHCLSPHCPGLLQIPTLVPQLSGQGLLPSQALEDLPGAWVSAHVKGLLSQPGPPSEVLLDDVGVKGQVWDWEPGKGEMLCWVIPSNPSVGK